MQFTRNLWVTYDVCIWVEIGQIQVICFFCLNMQHLGAVTGFAHRSLGSTFQQSLNQREIVLKLIARKSIQITSEILQWFVMIHFELISTVNKRIDRGNSSRLVCLFVWFYSNPGSFFIIHSCEVSWKIVREKKRKTNSAITTSFLWSTLPKIALLL